MTTIDLSINQRVADKLREVADLLEQQGANPFRVRAYRNAADTVVQLQRDLRELVQTEGLRGLKALPTIGQGIAAAIYELVTTGQWSQLERLRGTLDPLRLFHSIPGISTTLAQRIHDTLNVDTLEALEAAAHQGHLERVNWAPSRGSFESDASQYAWPGSQPEDCSHSSPRCGCVARCG